jgi:hypothetical protein
VNKPNHDKTKARATPRIVSPQIDVQKPFSMRMRNYGSSAGVLIVSQWTAVRKAGFHQEEYSMPRTHKSMRAAKNPPLANVRPI